MQFPGLWSQKLKGQWVGTETEFTPNRNEILTRDYNVSVLMDFVLQDTSRRYENKAGAFITGIDVTSKVRHKHSPPTQHTFLFTHWQHKHLWWCSDQLWGKRRVKTSVCVYQEAIERKEKRARRFHFCAEEGVRQRNVFLDKDIIKKGNKTKPPDLHVTT